MNIEEKTLALIKAQAAVTLHMAERLAMLHVAFEVFARQQIESRDETLEEHYEHRKQMLKEDSEGTTNALLNTLRQALHQIDN